MKDYDLSDFFKFSWPFFLQQYNLCITNIVECTESK